MLLQSDRNKLSRNTSSQIIFENDSMELDGPFLKSWPFRRTFARETRVRRFLCARETVKERPESAGRGDNLCRGPELVKNARSN